MQSFKNLTVIGTSHISIESIKEVREHINKKKPDIIALELDRQRLLSLMSDKKQKLNPFKMGLKVYVINLIGAYAERKLGDIVGVAPGSEMKTAVTMAKKHNLKIAVIDQDISITLKKLSKFITWKEKFRFLGEIITSPFKARQNKQLLKQIDLRKVPPDLLIQKILKKIKKDYPTIYKVLIHERNHIMANNLKKLICLNSDKHILAIVGAGHEKEIIQIIKRN
ncbi:MAG: TraB/GumN family protein [Nanoarchaeota archaeon]|nr:TraB/GumN family protein [Nanoarchaeota archaeon]